MVDVDIFRLWVMVGSVMLMMDVFSVFMKIFVRIVNVVNICCGMGRLLRVVLWVRGLCMVGI